MDATTIINRSPNASFEVVADEAILIHLVTGTYFSLNKVGTEFWQMLDGSATIADHAAKMAAQYDVEASIVEDDLLELATKMAADALVDIVS